MTERRITLTRRESGSYTATNAAGASVDFGMADGELSPVELLLAAVAGCSAIDVDVVTSRRAEPTTFEVVAAGAKQTDEQGRVKLDRVTVSFDVQFADDEVGHQAQRLVPRLMQLSHDKDCTVSRTVEMPTEVTFEQKSSGTDTQEG